MIRVKGWQIELKSIAQTNTEYYEAYHLESGDILKIRVANHAQVYPCDYSVDGVEGTYAGLRNFLNSYKEREARRIAKIHADFAKLIAAQGGLSSPRVAAKEAAEARVGHKLSWSQFAKLEN